MSDSLEDCIAIVPELGLVGAACVCLVLGSCWQRRHSTAWRIAIVGFVAAMIFGVAEVTRRFVASGTYFDGGNPALPELAGLAVAAALYLIAGRSEEARSGRDRQSNAAFMLAMLALGLAVYHVFDEPRAFDEGVLRGVFVDAEGEGRALRIDAFSMACRILMLLSLAVSLLLLFRRQEATTLIHVGKVLLAHALAMLCAETEHVLLLAVLVVLLGWIACASTAISRVACLVATVGVGLAVSALPPLEAGWSLDSLAFALDRRAQEGVVDTAMRVRAALGVGGSLWLLLGSTRGAGVGFAACAAPALVSALILRVAMATSGTTVVAPFLHSAFVVAALLCFAGALLPMAAKAVLATPETRRSGFDPALQSLLSIGIVSMLMTAFWDFTRSEAGIVEASHAREGVAACVVVLLFAWCLASSGLLLLRDERAWRRPAALAHKCLRFVFAATLALAPPTIGFLGLLAALRVTAVPEVKVWLLLPFGAACLLRLQQAILAWSDGQLAIGVEGEDRGFARGGAGLLVFLLALLAGVATVLLCFEVQIVTDFARRAAFGLRL